MLVAQFGTENGTGDGKEGKTGTEGVCCVIRHPDEGVFEVP